MLTSMLEEQHRACSEIPPASPWLQALETYRKQSGGCILNFISVVIKHFVWVLFRAEVWEMLPL